MPSPPLRAVVKSGVAHALWWTRGDALVGALADGRRWPLVVGYHRVVEDFASEARHAIPALLTSRAMLEQHLDWIGRRRRFVSLDELGRRLEDGAPLDRVAAVTFDDGYRDLYDVAFPLLARKGIPAAVFVVTDLVGTEGALIHDRLSRLLAGAFARWSRPGDALLELLAALDARPHGIAARPAPPADAVAASSWLLRRLARRDVERVAAALEVEGQGEAGPGARFVTWAMLTEMQRAGITVGSHTASHAWLTCETRMSAGEELEASRLAIERRLGSAPRHLAYPDGHYDARTLDLVEAAGYRYAYTTCRHADRRRPLLTIPRRLLWEHSSLDARGRFAPAVLSCEVHGVFDWMDRCGQDHGA